MPAARRWGDTDPRPTVNFVLSEPVAHDLATRLSAVLPDLGELPAGAADAVDVVLTNPEAANLADRLARRLAVMEGMRHA